MSDTSLIAADWLSRRVAKKRTRGGRQYHPRKRVGATSHMTIGAELELFEGKRLALLESMLRKGRSQKSVINELAVLLPESETEMQIRVTRLLK